MWINNGVVYNKHVGRNAVANIEMLTVKFKKGRNSILVKIENLGTNWGLYLKVMDPENELDFEIFED